MQKSLLFSVFLCFHFHFSSAGDKECVKGKEDKLQVKMYVFGDSYADTGNWNKVAGCWKLPYGITFPGKPTGRFSDGRILTDYVASFFEIESPMPYEKWNLLSSPEKLKKLEAGMNFAYGGTGVFNTDVPGPNTTSQIDTLERVINQYRPDFNTSIALVSVCGNDYSNYVKHPGNLTLPEFTESVVNQVVLDLERIHSLGIQKVVVTKMEPLGCLPSSTYVFRYANCTEGPNDLASSYNMLLQQNVDLLNHKTTEGTFFTLDLYGAFLSSLRGGSGTLGDLLKPCCQGITTNYACGSMEGSEAKYTVCEKPSMAFFWDDVHPAQNGWYQVYMAIKPTLESIFTTSTSHNLLSI